MARRTGSKNFMKVDDVNKKLEEGLKDIFESDRYKQMLQTMSKFHNYSVNNTIMIGIQKPNATMVKGFKGWQELGRTVNKGEKSIKILAPVIKEFEEENKQGDIEKVKRIVGFRMASVFDVSQTSGREIPSVRDFINRDLKNDESISKLYHDFKEHIQKEGTFTVEEKATENGVGGYYAPKTNEIVISNTENENDTEKFRVLVHEFAHGKLHNMESPYKDLPRGHKEAQAESVAYVVGNYYGMEQDDISLGYIATWSRDFKLAQQSIKEIQGASNEIIDVLDGLQKDKALEFYQQQEQEYTKSVDSLENQFNIPLRDNNGEVKNDVKNHVFQVSDREYGNVYSARLIESNQDDQLVCQLGNNRIIPITELNATNNEKQYIPIDIKVVDGHLDRRISTGDKQTNEVLREPQIKSIPSYERTEIKEIGEGNYQVQINDLPISNTFNTKEEAEDFKRHFELSEAINDRTYIENEKQLYDKNGIKDYELNQSVFKDEPSYKFSELDNYSQRYLISSVQKHLGINNEQHIINFEQAKAVSYELVSNKHIDSMDKLEDHVTSHSRHLPKMKRLQEEVEQMKTDIKEHEMEHSDNQQSNDKEIPKSQTQEVELER